MHDESRPTHIAVEARSRRSSAAAEGTSLAGETAETRPLADVSDDDLLRRLAQILAQSRRAEADLVAHVAEVDERRLYAREAFPSMFAYCTEALHLSESEAYLRIAVARASREHPMLLAMLGDGRLHLSAIALLAPLLTRENRATLLQRATHRSKRQVEALIAELAPRGDVPALMRRLPRRSAPTPSGMGRRETPHEVLALDPAAADSSSLNTAGDPAPLPGNPSLRPLDSASAPPAPPLASSASPVGLLPSRPVVQPLAPGRYKVQFTASAELRDKLERLTALMGASVPDGDLGAIIEAVVTEKLERLEARRFAMTRRPRQGLSTADTSPSSRHIPAAVRRAVRERDGNRCRYVDAAGRRCGARDHLEYHHLRPFGFGGDHRPENLRMMCRLCRARHNRHYAESRIMPSSDLRLLSVAVVGARQSA
jgi:5-methylcytosine-specific restriction endonuclease McrA